MTKRAYAYIRVSTYTQVDGKSLDGQLEEIRQYCKAFNITLVNVYSDEGHSGKSIEGRPAFKKMLSDIDEKQEVDYVIVWKLSRFGRNACDSLNSLNYLQARGVNLITLKENLDTSTQIGKLVFTLLAALAEMERENIREQTLNGKKYTALAGAWNGGVAPYGYSLQDKSLIINPEEAEVVRNIFEWYLEDVEIGYAGVCAKLNDAKIIPRQKKRLDRKAMQLSNSEEPIYLPMVSDWYSTMVRDILDNPVYMGKIRYGHYPVKTLPNGETTRVYTDDCILVDGQHEALVSEEVWKAAQDKRERMKKHRGRKDSDKEFVHNIFNKIAKCPQCGGNMVASSPVYKSGDKKVYYSSYVCGYNNNHKHGGCSRNSIRAEFLESTVLKAVGDYVNKPGIIEEIQKRMEADYDTAKLEGEIKNLKEQLVQLDKAEEIQYNILSQIGLAGKYRNLDPEKVSKAVDKIVEQREEAKLQLENKIAQVEAFKLKKLDYEAIKGLLVKFNEICATVPKELKKKLLQSLVKEVKLGYNEKGKVIPVSMTIKFTGEQIELMSEAPKNFGLNVGTAETVALLTKKDITDKGKRDFSVELEVPISPVADQDYKEKKPTYENIKKYIMEKHGVKVHTAYIAEVKRDCELDMRPNYNVSRKEEPVVKYCTPEKREYIMEALRYYKLVV